MSRRLFQFAQLFQVATKSDVETMQVTPSKKQAGTPDAAISLSTRLGGTHLNCPKFNFRFKFVTHIESALICSIGSSSKNKRMFCKDSGVGS